MEVGITSIIFSIIVIGLLIMILVPYTEPSFFLGLVFMIAGILIAIRLTTGAKSTNNSKTFKTNS